MTEDEAYKVHIQYTFNAFCKIVIRHAAIDKILKLRRRSLLVKARWSRPRSRLAAGKIRQREKPRETFWGKIEDFCHFKAGALFAYGIDWMVARREQRG